MKQKLYTNKNWLEEQYIVNGLSSIEISKICNVKYKTICLWLNKFNIPIKRVGNKKEKRNCNYKNKKWLYNQYSIAEKSAMEIGKECSVCEATIRNWLKKFGIKIRNQNECRKGKLNGRWISNKIKNSNLLYQEYVINKKSINKLAKEYEVGSRTIQRYLEEYNIPRRPTGITDPNFDPSLSICPDCNGKKGRIYNRCWGCYTKYINENPRLSSSSKGIHDVKITLRHHSSINWRPKVFARDNYTCQICGDSKGGNLNAHHIERFSDIIDNLIKNTNLDMSNLNDRIKMIKICKKDKKINDINNGITLCENCHVKQHTKTV